MSKFDSLNIEMEDEVPPWMTEFQIVLHNNQVTAVLNPLDKKLYFRPQSRSKIQLLFVQFSLAGKVKK